MARNNKKHLMIKESQRRITFADFAAIQDSLGLSNEQIALLLGLSLSAVESFHGGARQKDLCGAPVTASILLLKFLNEKAPGAFSRVKDGFHAWAFAYESTK